MQPDPEAANAFYGELFGWQFENAAPAGSPGPYYIARLHGLTVAAIGGPAEAERTPVWNTYACVENVERSLARVQQAGGSVLAEPMDIPDAGRMAVFADAQGAVFSLWEPDGFIGAELVNEPGSWNFSELNTRDPEAAKRFYASVLDWDTISFEMGESGFTFFTLAGYGDFLAKSNPDLIANQDADGATAGFENAVAWLIDQRTLPDASDAPVHWSVTFATDDADGIASRAERLGGNVLVPPFDAEPVRMTVIADPQGTVFTASKYQPSQGT
jgi:predicted enzyme related to lactoylglutathione lyase